MAEMEEMEEMRDQMSAMSDQMSAMNEQLGLLPSQLRLLGRQSEEMKGRLGRLADEQAVMGKRVEEMSHGQLGMIQRLEEVQRDVKERLEEVGDEQHNMMQQQSDHLCKEVREETKRAVQKSVQKEVHEGVNGELSDMRKEMSQMTQEIKWMKDQCSGLEGLVLEVHEAGREMYEVRQEFDRVGACTECIWEFLTKEVGKGFEPAVRRSFGVLGDVLVEAVEEMRQMSDDMSVRQGRFEEVARESVRQEVRVQECMGTAVSEEMSKSDERLRGVLRDLKGQLGVLQKEMRVGMMRVQQRGGRGEEVMSENGSSAAATELAEGRRAREKGAGLWEGAVYEGQQGEGVQLFAGPPMQWVGGGRE